RTTASGQIAALGRRSVNGGVARQRRRSGRCGRGGGRRPETGLLRPRGRPVRAFPSAERRSGATSRSWTGSAAVEAAQFLDRPQVRVGCVEGQPVDGPVLQPTLPAVL